MNKTIEELYNRKSVRVFSDEPITKEEKEIIMNAALQAPTGGNMCLYSMIDVQSQALKDLLADRCDHQPMISKAPFVLMFNIDYQKWYDMFKEYCDDEPIMGEGDLLLAASDCAIAAQNAVVAAQSMGIGSCYIGDIVENFELNRETFNLPEYVVPFVMVIFGRPTQSQMDRKKPQRFALEDMVSVDTYHRKSLEETKQMFIKQTGRKEEDLGRYIKAFGKRKFYTEFRYEMNRSCREIIKVFKEK